VGNVLNRHGKVEDHELTYCYMTEDSTVECTVQAIPQGRYAGRVLVITVTSDGHQELRFTLTTSDPDAASALDRARSWAQARYAPMPQRERRERS